MDRPITLCDRCDMAASCLLNYDGIPCRKNRTVQFTNADRIRVMSDEKLARLVKIGGKGMSKCKECIFYSRPGNEWPCSSCKTIRILEEEDHFTSPEQYYKTIGEKPKKGKWVRCVAANYN